MAYRLHLAISLWYSSTTIQNNTCSGQYIPNIVVYKIIRQQPRDIHLKSLKLSINRAKYEKQYSPSHMAMIAITSRLRRHQILLSPSHTPLTKALIGNHVLSTHFPACWLALVAPQFIIYSPQSFDIRKLCIS